MVSSFSTHSLSLYFSFFIFPMLLKCLIMLRSSMVISPHGTSETWPPCLQVRSTLFFWLVFFTFYFCAALIEFLYNISPFFSPVLSFSLDFSLCCCGAAFQLAEAFDGDLSAWEVGKVINMDYSTYTLSLSKIGSFFG